MLFLFDRNFTIYGGNIASTLAGEFAFSISLSLALLYLGVVIRGLRTGQHRALAAVLLALTGLCHLIPAFFALGPPPSSWRSGSGWSCVADPGPAARGRGCVLRSRLLSGTVVAAGPRRAAAGAALAPSAWCCPRACAGSARPSSSAAAVDVLGLPFYLRSTT